MVVSRAGDWTGAFIDDPPDPLWVRGLPAVGVANVRRLFTKVVFVVTGSGIGPGLGHLLAAEGPTKLVWITRAPRPTYGDALVDEVLAAQPDALIWNTDYLDVPADLALTHLEYLSSDAEAVVVHRQPCRHGAGRARPRVPGIPAFGPIWDS